VARAALMLSQLGPDGWLLVALLVGAAYGIGWFVGARRPVPREAGPARLPEPPGTTAATPAAASETAVLRPDRATLGRYRIERELGRGSMGTVYLGHDPQIGRAVAIKTMALTREFEGSELAEARARFFREAEMAGRLRHPDIVTIFDASEDQGLAFIAMEFVTGHDLLRHTLPGRLLPVPVVLHTLARVARALAHAHREGVIHRDVKPANVMIDPATGAVKVTDFGIARIADACRTRTGLVLGTPSFMSPEQMAGRRVDGRTDLYSLGVMLFQLLTGSLPHRSESMATLMRQIVNDTAPDVRSLRPELPEALANVVALALEKRVEVRYGDGHQMADDLLAVAALLGGPEPAAPAQAGSAAVTNPPESAGFEATVAFSPNDPRHNPRH
jgi:eukaryotic-like serine/threonine-protein kinase